MIECPKCNREFEKPGLHGHLRFSHGLRGQELEQAYEAAQEEHPRQEDEQGLRKQGVGSEGGEPADETSREAESASQQGRTREARPVPSGVASAQEKSEAQERSGSGRETPSREERPPADPLLSAVERLRRARARKKAVEGEMKTEKRRSGIFKSGGEEVPANPTWRELLEECEAEVEAARKELHREVEHREVDRSV